MTKKLPEYPTFREWCIGEIALMFGYVDPMDRESTSWGTTRSEVGQLVSICSAPNSIWGFSWVEEVQNTSRGEYCLRAVGTDQLCDWTNISLCPFKKDRYEHRDDLKWWPNQYDFWIKTRKAYFKAGIDKYDFSLTYPKFLDNGKAEIGFRCHIFSGEREPPKPVGIENFEKVTIKSIQERIIDAREGWKDD